MKNLILILLMACFSFASFAQDKSAELKYDETKIDLNLGAKDTIGIGDSTYVINIRKKNTKVADAYAYFDLGKTAAVANKDVTILQKGKVTTNSPWTTVNTVTWRMSVDTTFTMNAASKDYEYYQYTITGELDEQRATIEKAEFKFVEQ